MGKPRNEIQRHGEGLKRSAGTMSPKSENPERDYLAGVDDAHRKAFGQFFTPADIAAVMADWISGCKPKTILDPAVGPGILLFAARRQNPDSILFGIDIDEAPLQFAKARLQPPEKVELSVADFLLNGGTEPVDAITCNPPYVRHHLLNYEDDVYSRASSVIPGISRSSNLYVLFVAAIWNSLKPGGRASILLPADWLNANYGVALKKFLIESRSVRRIVYFTNDFDLFDDALTTAVILMIEKRIEQDYTEVVTVTNASRNDLAQLGSKSVKPFSGGLVFRVDLRELDVTQKWDRILQGTRVDQPASWLQLGLFGKTKRGIATGANKYFHLSYLDIKANKLDLGRTRQCIGKAADAKGIVFDQGDVDHLRESSRFFLLDLDDSFPMDQDYLKIGSREGLPQRFLMASRKRWWDQEMRTPAQFWVGVFGRDGIRFVRNRTSVLNLTCFHCLYLPDFDELELDAIGALLNSSLVQRVNEASERAYGGGLRKVEPRDLLQMSVPNISSISRADLTRLADALTKADGAIRSNDRNWREILDAAVSAVRIP